MRLLTSEYLSSVKMKAIRRGVWFSNLSKLERNIVELTIKYVNRIQSSKLALVIGRILCKLLKSYRSVFLEQVEAIGKTFAKRIGKLAVSWGLSEASAWLSDPSFIRFLGVNTVSNSSYWNYILKV